MTSAPSVDTLVRPPLPVDLDLTLAPLGRGPYDLCVRPDEQGTWWRACRTPEGPATTAFSVEDGAIRVRAWGPGARVAADRAPRVLGCEDVIAGFAPTGKLRDLHRRFASLRIGRSDDVYEAMVRTVLEQKVSGMEARLAFDAMVRAWGTPAPGPMPLFILPEPELLARKAYFDLHGFGIERRRADTLRHIAARADKLEQAVHMQPAEAQRWLQLLDGIGPWSAAMVVHVALGDANAVAVGDYNLPHLVTYAFTGAPRGSDEKMLELLAPFEGHRARVIRLLGAAGITPPRFGPRKAMRRFRYS